MSDVIVVTGGAGFIGSNLVRSLNAAGHAEIIVVDDLTDGTKFRNLAGAKFADYLDKDEFRARITGAPGKPAPPVAAVFHQGACSTTTEWNGRYMLDTNYEYSRDVFAFCLARRVPLVYASTAATYGDGRAGFSEQEACEDPLNIYGWSKLLFDNWVRKILAAGVESQVVGLRYFNVYGPREQHKGGMASVAFHLHHQLLKDGRVRLFEGSDGYTAGEQRRDFIHVDDANAVNLWFLDHPARSGVFNCGTGRAQTFNEVAQAVLRFHGRGELEYVPFPEQLRGRYQSYTQADLTRLREAGCDVKFRPVEDGVRDYLAWLTQGPSREGAPARARTGTR